MSNKPILTLEKGEDGVYRIPDNQKEHGHKARVRHKKNIHEFIVDNGDKVTDFLDGISKTVKTIIQVSKIIHPK